MQTIELLEHIVRLQGELYLQAQTLETMTKTLNLACQRIVALEEQLRPLGNNTLPKNKTSGRVIPLSLVARDIARDL